MRIELKVPLEDIQSARDLGAQYDNVKRVWYVDNPIDIKLYVQWSPEKQSRPILKLNKKVEHKPKGIIKKKRVIQVEPKKKTHKKKTVPVKDLLKEHKTKLYFYQYRKKLEKKINQKIRKLDSNNVQSTVTTIEVL